jgi:hypothetical protein
MLTGALFCAACTTAKDGEPVASAQPPQDVWQLADQLVQRIPLTATKFEELVGSPLHPDKQNPMRLEGGAVQLSANLHIPSSVIAIIDGTWSFASIDIEPTPCITEDDVRSRYPAAENTHLPTGHSVNEESLWSVTYDWGTLNFGIREKERCLTGISVERAKS